MNTVNTINFSPTHVDAVSTDISNIRALIESLKAEMDNLRDQLRGLGPKPLKPEGAEPGSEAYANYQQAAGQWDQAMSGLRAAVGKLSEKLEKTAMEMNTLTTQKLPDAQLKDARAVQEQLERTREQAETLSASVGQQQETAEANRDQTEKAKMKKANRITTGNLVPTPGGSGIV